MTFKVSSIPSAEKDLEDAIEYYNSIYFELAQKFYYEFEELNEVLQNNPFFEIRYKNIRVKKLKSFPYLIHFIVNEQIREVIIIAIVFGKQKQTDFSFRVA